MLLLSVRSVGQMQSKVDNNGEYTNWLNYNVFRSMEVGSFVRTLQEKLADKQNVFKLALVELYGQGQLLSRKNHFLNLAFVCLGIGINFALLITLIKMIFGPVK
jgi:Cu/Ag efflux pump CusA